MCRADALVRQPGQPVAMRCRLQRDQLPERGVVADDVRLAEPGSHCLRRRPWRLEHPGCVSLDVLRSIVAPASSTSLSGVGYAFGTIDEMGDGVFRKVRRSSGVTAFGVNVLVIPRASTRGRTTTRSRTSSTSSTPAARASRCPARRASSGRAGSATSSRPTPRQITSVGDEALVMLVVGAKDGYVGRDGRPADPAKLG